MTGRQVTLLMLSLTLSNLYNLYRNEVSGDDEIANLLGELHEKVDKKWYEEYPEPPDIEAEI